MTLEQAIAALPPMASAYDLLTAYIREGLTIDDALAWTWDAYRAIQQQRKDYAKGKRG